MLEYRCCVILRYSHDSYKHIVHRVTAQSSVLFVMRKKDSKLRARGGSLGEEFIWFTTM